MMSGGLTEIELISIALEKLQIRSSETFADIGCGTGFTSLELAQRLGNESKIYCLDPWQAALDRLKEKAKYFNIKNFLRY